MKILLPLCALSMAACFTVASAQDADPVDRLQQTYQQALDLAAEPLKDLDDNYTVALGKLKDKVQKQGDLQNTLKVQNEIENYAKPGERKFDDLPGLQRLRKIYEQSRPEVQKEVHAKQRDILKQSLVKFEKLTADLTTQGNLKDALRSREAKKSVITSLEKLLSGHELEPSEPAQQGFEEWFGRVSFLAASRTTMKYRDGAVVITRISGKNENNKATIGHDLKIEFQATAGPAYIQVRPDRKTAVYMLKSKLAARLQVIDPKLEK